jgi:acyl-CoA reductase-like NAD-dependent aldehyde dehydrogenase
MSAAARPAPPNGSLTTSGQRAMIDVENPATGQTVGAVEQMTAADLQRLAERGRTAQREWQALGFAERRHRLLRAQRWLADHRERVTDVMVAESGKSRADAMTEIVAAAESLLFWANNAERHLGAKRLRTASPLLLGRSVTVRYAPLGLVGVITPWNAPFSLAMLDLVPAIAAGNAVVLKPSEVAPLSAELIEDMFRAAGVPEHVFQVAHGDGSTGAALVDVVDFIAFTGSPETGRKVAERAGRNLIGASLELGGNDAMIVLADADLERAAGGAVFYAMANAGQVCMGVERVYVEAPVHDRFVELVVEKVQELRLGSGDERGPSEIGPIIFAPQIDKIADHVQDALAKGARLLTGGRRSDRPGRFYEPTVLVDVDHSMKVMTDETFGPVLPIMKARDADEAVRLANDSRYGLQSTVWTRDRARGRAIATRLESGGVNLNDAFVNLAAFDAPFGGWKDSGLGRRHGSGGIQKYCQAQTITDNRMPLRRDPFWFPASDLLGRAFGAFVALRARLRRG